MNLKATFYSFLILWCLPSFGNSFEVKETSFSNGELQLLADLFIPDDPIGEGIGIALIQGSGNSDRSNAWSRSFAIHLANAGYYVLLPDKRGCGESGGDWKTASFEMLAEDAMASVIHLKSEMKLNKVGIMGLSQGGFIAPIVAGKSDQVEFIVNVVGAAVSLEEQIIHEVSCTALKEGVPASELAEILELHVLMKNYAINGDWQPLKQKYLQLSKSPIAEFVATFPRDSAIWVWEWIRLNLEFNPIDHWSKTNQPSFVAYGSKDQDDNMPVYQSAYRLQQCFNDSNQSLELHIYDCGHAMYEDDRAELRAEFMQDLLNWLSQFHT